MRKPLFAIMSGPNGAGKSTAAAEVVSEGIEYLNADEMAKSMPGYPSQAADIQASRHLLFRMDDLEMSRSDFAMETTLASRSLAARVIRLRQSGYEFRLVFAFVPDVEMSISRVRLGGHNIPEETIRRRYLAKIANFFGPYRPLADRWYVSDTTVPEPIKLIAEGGMDEEDRIVDPVFWDLMKRKANDV